MPLCFPLFPTLISTLIFGLGTMSSSVHALQEKVKKLGSDVMRGKWSEVFETYKQERVLRTAMITATGDTVLHMVVSKGEQKVLANMVDLVLEEKTPKPQNNEVVVGGSKQSLNVNVVVLGVENDRKNTPLHLAAIKGNVEMCKKISGANPSLVAKRNISGETPLFLAALYGRKEAFLWLHNQYISHLEVSSTDFAYCKRDNGDTILHSTIAEGHIDVAIEIVHLYKDHLKEMMNRNKEGLSPLHLLAATPSAFKSIGLVELRAFGDPIYWFWKVEEKNQATTLQQLQQSLKVDVEALDELLQKKYQGNILAIKFVYWLRPFLLRPFSDAGKWLYDMVKNKEKHTWSLQILNELLLHTSAEDMSQIISRTTSEHISISQQKEENKAWESMATPASGTIIIETPLMIAVKNGVVEMVDKILELFPSRIKDVNVEGRNIVLLAVEYRQTQVYRFLCKQKWLTESGLFGEVDKEGNNALHLAAKLGVEPDWLNSGESLSMSREINWFELVKESMPRGLWERYNRKMETPEDIFQESHKQLMKSEGEWVAKASQACSVVSMLVTSAAFTTRISVPGGYDNNGYAILRNNPAFKTFEISSYIALAYSFFSTIYFLSIVASHHSQFVQSWRCVPFKLHLGMFLMFVSIVSLWISFLAAGFFMLDDGNQNLQEALPRYISSSLTMIIFVASQLITFIGPTLSCYRRIPDPRCKTTRPIEYRRTENIENGTDLNHKN